MAALALAGAVAPACRVEVGGADGAPAVAATDTLHYRCDGGPTLRPDSTAPLQLPVDRLLTVGEEILAVTEAGELVRLSRGNDPLLSGGKDYDVRDGVVARLSRDRVSFFRYERGRPSPLPGGVRVEPHEFSLALAGGELYLHSPIDPSNVLVTVRDRATGEPTGAFLPVERSFLRLLLDDPDAMLADLGRLRAAGEALAFVPLVRDPVLLVTDRPRTLFLADGERGTVRTVESDTTGPQRACPTCDQHREVETRQDVRRLYADAAFDPTALWLLRLSPPGSARVRLLRVDPTGPGRPDVRVWRLADLDLPPRALGVSGGSIAVADGRHVHHYPVPPASSGSACAPR